MRARVLTIANPFDPLRSRSLVELRRPRRVRALAPRGGVPVIALLNGTPLLRAAWRRRLRDGDQLVFSILPRGGGGGGGSNPLRTLLSLALFAFAPWAAGAALGGAASTVLFGSFTLGQATQLGIMFAGQAAINALLPVSQGRNQPAASPTYSLQAQGNAARIEQAIPVQYGRILAYPDFAAQPYTEFAGDEQYLYQLLCLGAGEYDIEEMRIEDTPISAFEEIETEIVPPGQPVTLFPTSVVSSLEVSGQDMPGRKDATYIWSGTVVTITEVAHNRPTGAAVSLQFNTGGANTTAYEIATVIDADTYTVVHASGSGSGTLYARSIIGGLEGYVAAGPGTVAQRLAIDLILPSGLYKPTSGGPKHREVAIQFQIRQVDDSGAAMGAWISLPLVNLRDKTTTPLRRSISHTLATPGRYRFRAWRTDEKATDSGHDVNLSGLRSYLAGDQTFGPVTLIALRMRATNNLSLQASRKVGVIATRKVPVWTGSTWTAPQASRSIAWAIADAARNTDYGARLPDRRLDIAALLALDAVWAARGDRFDGRFDQAGTWWEAVSRIALTGRARLFFQGGVLRVVRDGAASLPVALFSMRNIRRGSFSVDYLMPTDETADVIDVGYLDEATWMPQRVTARLAGSSAERPSKLDLFGATQRAHALREGLYHAAANRYRRRIVRFSTEMEGFIPSIGDLIAIQHDMPGWGAQAEAVAWNAGTRHLTLTEPMIFAAGNHYVGLRRRDGSLSGPWLVTPGPVPETVVLAETPDLAPYTGTEEERTHVVFGAAASWRVLARLASARPRGLYEVEIEAVVDDPSVHTADAGVTAPPIRISSLPRHVTRPVVRGLMAIRMPDDPTRVVLAWQPAPGADQYQIEMAEGADPGEADISWTRAADTTAAHYVLTLLYTSQTLIRVRGIGLAAGDWVAASIGDLVQDFWSIDSDLFWTADPTLFWSS